MERSIVISAGAIGYDGKYICMIFGYFCGFSFSFKIQGALCFVKRNGNEWNLIGKERKSPDETQGKTERKEIIMTVVYRIIELFQMSGDDWRVYRIVV